jgi:signal transduction histidine kinase
MLKSTSEALNDRLFNIMQWVKSVLEHGSVTPCDFKLAEVVDECIQNQAYTFEMKSLRVVNEVPFDMMAYDDVSVVSLVLQNLLSNAVKFSYPNGEIHIKAEQKDLRIWVSVSDNGMGISEKKLEKIFRFLANSEMGTEGERGTGIGLFVSKQLLDKTGGEISIESVIDEGTTVRFSVKS